MEKITLKVEGMACARCEKKVNEKLTELGCQNVAASAENGRISLDFDSGKISQTEIEECLADLGYDIA